MIFIRCGKAPHHGRLPRLFGARFVRDLPRRVFRPRAAGRKKRGFSPPARFPPLHAKPPAGMPAFLGIPAQNPFPRRPTAPAR
jgi:hypothetical protein